MEEKYPKDYLFSRTGEICKTLLDRNITIIEGRDATSEKSLKIFKELYENTFEIWPDMSYDCLSLVYIGVTNEYLLSKFDTQVKIDILDQFIKFRIEVETIIPKRTPPPSNNSGHNIP